MKPELFIAVVFVVSGYFSVTIQDSYANELFVTTNCASKDIEVTIEDRNFTTREHRCVPGYSVASDETNAKKLADENNLIRFPKKDGWSDHNTVLLHVSKDDLERVMD